MRRCSSSPPARRSIRDTLLTGGVEVVYEAGEDRVSINEFHATILHRLGLNRLGLNPEQRTYFHNGRSVRLPMLPTM